MANQQTGNYQLSQWESTDRIQMEDFNSDNEKIDAALAAKADASALTALQAQVANCGNCKIVTGSYTGTGTYGEANKNTLTFSRLPLLVFVCGDTIFYAHSPASGGKIFKPGSSSSSTLNFTWGSNSLSWHSISSAEYQANSSGVIYHYAALFLTQ